MEFLFQKFPETYVEYDSWLIGFLVKHALASGRTFFEIEDLIVSKPFFFRDARSFLLVAPSAQKHVHPYIFFHDSIGGEGVCDRSTFAFCSRMGWITPSLCYPTLFLKQPLLPILKLLRAGFKKHVLESAGFETSLIEHVIRCMCDPQFQQAPPHSFPPPPNVGPEPVFQDLF